MASIGRKCRHSLTLADSSAATRTRASKPLEEKLHLTKREKQIVKRVLKGEKREAIAADLAICRRTVTFHLTNVRRKFKQPTVFAAAIFFVRHPSFLNSVPR